jgi:hypothetical protein
MKDMDGNPIGLELNSKAKPDMTADHKKARGLDEGSRPMTRGLDAQERVHDLPGQAELNEQNDESKKLEATGSTAATGNNTGKLGSTGTSAIGTDDGIDSPIGSPRGSDGSPGNSKRKGRGKGGANAKAKAKSKGKGKRGRSSENIAAAGGKEKADKNDKGDKKDTPS